MRTVITGTPTKLKKVRERDLPADKVLDNFSGGARFSRKTWGLLSLELWHRIYHDRAHEYRGMLDDEKFVTEEQLTT